MTTNPLKLRLLAFPAFWVAQDIVAEIESRVVPPGPAVETQLPRDLAPGHVVTAITEFGEAVSVMFPGRSFSISTELVAGSITAALCEALRSDVVVTLARRRFVRAREMPPADTLARYWAEPISSAEAIAARFNDGMARNIRAILDQLQRPPIQAA